MPESIMVWVCFETRMILFLMCPASHNNIAL